MQVDYNIEQRQKEIPILGPQGNINPPADDQKNMQTPITKVVNVLQNNKTDTDQKILKNQKKTRPINRTKVSALREANKAMTRFRNSAVQQNQILSNFAKQTNPRSTKLFGETEFPIVLRKSIPDQLREQTQQKLLNAFPANAFNLNNSNRIHSSLLDGASRLQNLKKKKALMTTLSSNLIDKNNAFLSKSSYFTWDPKKSRYESKIKGVQKKIQTFMKSERRYPVVLANSYNLLDLKLTPEQTNKYVPQLVSSLIEANNEFSENGIGPIKTGGIPLYAGRWLDPITGRVRILPKASSKYLNPASYQAKKSYLQALVVNKWNNFVNAEEQYYNLMEKKPQQYKQKQMNMIKRGVIEFTQDYENAIVWMYNQIAAYEIGFGAEQSTRIVLSAMEKFSGEPFYKQFKKKIIQLYFATRTGLKDPNAPKKQRPKKPKKGEKADQNAPLQINRKTLIDLNKQYLTVAMEKTIAAIKSPNTDGGIKLRNSIVKSFSVWMSKGLGKVSRALTKAAKTMIPDDLNENELEETYKIDKVLQSLKSNMLDFGDEKNQDALKKLTLEQIYQNQGSLQNLFASISSLSKDLQLPQAITPEIPKIIINQAAWGKKSTIPNLDKIFKST